jgi:hypothetical protein
MLCLAFFLSGSAALLFETLWFRQTGLVLGNSVWATSLVLAAFMIGLCAGNGLAGRYGSRVRRPVLAYAGLEVLVGATGLGLVLVLPKLTTVVAPILRPLATHTVALNGARASIALLLMAVPATAMGMTLPLLVRALSAEDRVFGRALGRLYGWNTLGAVTGALAGEWLLVPVMGLRSIGAVAALLNVLAGAVAVLAARHHAIGPAPATLPAGRPGGRALRLLLAAACAGAAFMALEVVWFRFLLLFLYGTSATFAAMLAAVLLGIALGGLCASSWLGSRPKAGQFAAVIAALAGSAVVSTYAYFAEALPAAPGLIVDDRAILRLCLTLMLPVSWLSGVLFVLIGESLKSGTDDEAWATGSLSLANTAGAATGALAGGFCLIPYLGVETSLFALSVVYGGIAVLLLPEARPGLRDGKSLKLALAGAAASYVVLVALFPFGLMRNGYMKRLSARWADLGFGVVAAREGLTESLLYLEEDMWGTPVAHRLVTNGFSMSGTGVLGRRYMRLFADWPRALHPGARRALLISFGVGTTAQALVDTKALETIDVVDISADILDMGRVIFRGRPYPLDDPRVRVHVEDGRFFLATTGERFDVITAEPPPPKNAGITTLYSLEFFSLVRDRLAEGGVATYWLPVYQMTSRESRSIAAGFCGAFPDCSLWTGSGPEWMLVGTRDARGPVDEAAFSRPWTDPATAGPLLDSGIEGPEFLGALFIADAADLRAWVGDAPPLDDDHPGRLSRVHLGIPNDYLDEYAAWMDTRETRRRFETSPLVRRLWPEAVRRRTLAAFDAQGIVNDALWRFYRRSDQGNLQALGAALRGSSLRMPVVWLMASGADEQHAAASAVARGRSEPILDEFQGIDAMAARDYRRAEAFFARAEPFAAHAARLRQWRVLALGLAGDVGGAAALMESASPLLGAAGSEPADWSWLSHRFGRPSPPPPR